MLAAEAIRPSKGGSAMRVHYTDDMIDSFPLRRLVSLTPGRLHGFAERFNWDGGWHKLRQIIRDPRCALGTALMLYWRGKPYFFRAYTKASEVEDYLRQNFDLLRAIERGVAQGRFQHHGVAYDPSRDKGTDWTAFFYPEVPNLRDIPDEMFVATTRGGSRVLERPSSKRKSAKKAKATARKKLPVRKKPTVARKPVKRSPVST
jgi:hypothetical protein